MTETQVLQWFYDTGLGNLIRDSKWLFGAGETIHFIGLSLLMGAMLMVDLRLIGVLKRVPMKAALAFTHVAIFGFVLNVLSGLAFFASNPFSYWPNPAFKMKMFLIVLAGINMIWFELAERKKVTAMADHGSTDLMTKIVACLSLTLWMLIIFFGRMLPTFEGADSFFAGF